MKPKSWTQPYRVVVVTKIKRVTTFRGLTQVIQSHRGFTPVIYVEGHREPFRTDSFHQKRKGAIAAGEWYARKLLREQAAQDRRES